jgi:HEAT repeat protein
MGTRLLTLVQGTQNMAHLDYVIANMRPITWAPEKNLAFTVSLGSWTANHKWWQIRSIAIARKLFLASQSQQMAGRIAGHFWLNAQSYLVDKKKTHEQLNQQMELFHADPEILRNKVHDADPVTRLVVVQAIGQRRLPLGAELIGRLEDAEPLIRDAAHRSLVRLSRGNDFGPRPGGTLLDHKKALRQWLTWWAYEAPHAAGPAPVPPDAAERAALRYRTEILQAANINLDRALDKVQKAASPAATHGLSAACAEMKGTPKAKARQVLVERLADLPEEKLKEKLADADGEMRRAAALACGQKKFAKLIPAVLKCLEDEEPEVAQAARASLKELTGKDFGPLPNAAPLDQFRAIGQWYGWWEQNRGK